MNSLKSGGPELTRRVAMPGLWPSCRSRLAMDQGFQKRLRQLRGSRRHARPRANSVSPDPPAGQGQAIEERRLPLGVSRRPLPHQVTLALPPQRQQRDEREQAQQLRRRPRDRPVGPLPLRLHAQVGPGLLEGLLPAPASHHQAQDPLGPEPLVGAEVGRVPVPAFGVAGQDMADRHRVKVRDVPQAGAGDDPHSLAPATVPVHLDRLAGGGRVGCPQPADQPDAVTPAVAGQLHHR